MTSLFGAARRYGGFAGVDPVDGSRRYGNCIPTEVLVLCAAAGEGLVPEPADEAQEVERARQAHDIPRRRRPGRPVVPRAHSSKPKPVVPRGAATLRLVARLHVLAVRPAAAPAPHVAPTDVTASTDDVTAHAGDVVEFVGALFLQPVKHR